MGSLRQASALKRMSWKGHTIEKRVEKKVAKAAAPPTMGLGERTQKGPWVRAAKMVHQSESEIFRYMMATTWPYVSDVRKPNVRIHESGFSESSARPRSSSEEPHATSPIQPATMKSTGRFHFSGSGDGMTWS